MKDMFDYFDDFGLPIQHKDHNGDGGDSASFAGHLAHGYYLLHDCWGLIDKHDYIFADKEHFFEALEKHLLDEKGRLRRSPHPGMWYEDFLRGSRDQYRGVINCLAKMSYDGNQRARKLLKKILKDHLYGGLETWLPPARLGMFASNTRHNHIWLDREEHMKKAPERDHDRWEKEHGKKVPDFMGAFSGVWGAYIRGLWGKKWWAYPVLAVLDLKLVFESWNKENIIKEDTDILNHLSSVILGILTCPTFMTKLAWSMIDKDDYVERLCKRYEKKWYEPFFIGEMWIDVLVHVRSLFKALRKIEKSV